ncbi:MAG: ribonuclease VapC12 [Acidimicrobiia bacterium]|nr:MAG: ribonuclease VapC12 [Acidimicrobiia bacterium]
MIVLDASAALELLLNTEGGELVRARIADPSESLHAPHLLAVEVAQVLRRYVASRSVTAEVAVAALEDLAGLDIAHYAHEPFLGRIWELRENVTAYDAAYLTLAEVLDAPLLTFDGKLATAPGHDARVELLSR